MKAYERFIPRGRPTTRPGNVAEAAEVAEAQACQGAQAAEALLRRAELRIGGPQPQQSSAEPQQAQSRGQPALQQDQQLQQPRGPASWGTHRQHGAAAYQDDTYHCAQCGEPLGFEGEWSEAAEGDATSRVHLSCRRKYLLARWSGLPVTWVDGVIRVAAMPPPHRFPQHAWQQLIVDAGRFLDGWAAQAEALNWPDWELFGCHRRAPWARIQGMGLVLLLRGKELAAMTAAEAVIRTASGSCLTYRRKERDPLHPAERGLIWQLA